MTWGWDRCDKRTAGRGSPGSFWEELKPSRSRVGGDLTYLCSHLSLLACGPLQDVRSSVWTLFRNPRATELPSPRPWSTHLLASGQPSAQERKTAPRFQPQPASFLPLPCSTGNFLPVQHTQPPRAQTGRATSSFSGRGCTACASAMRTS